MLCIRENCFSEPSTPNPSRGEPKKSEYFQVFENMTESLVIMYDPYDDIDCLSRYAEETMRPIVVYIFSMSPEIWEEEIASIRADIRIETIPDEILETYKKIFGF